MADLQLFDIPLPVPLVIFAFVSIGLLIFILKSDPASEPGLSGPRPHQHPHHDPAHLMGLPRISYIELPALPGHLKYWGIRTEVVLEFIVNKAGKASQIRMVQASHAEMVRPSIEAVRHATFLPARNEHNEPIEHPMVFPVHAPIHPMPQQRPPPHRAPAEVTKFPQAG